MEGFGVKLNRGVEVFARKSHLVKRSLKVERRLCHGVLRSKRQAA
jgi:hypothetical protein